MDSTSRIYERAQRVLPGADQCEEFGTYGPWGHPMPEERDYSLAREKPSLGPES